MWGTSWHEALRRAQHHFYGILTENAKFAFNQGNLREQNGATLYKIIGLFCSKVSESVTIKTKELSQIIKDKQDMTTTCHVCFRFDPGAKKKKNGISETIDTFT